MTDALVIVDWQNDFVYGSLAVPGAADALPAIQRLAKTAPLVAATRDWHPPSHLSFAANGGKWPAHCVVGSWGAEYADNIGNYVTFDWNFKKGSDQHREEYSGALARDVFDRKLVHRLRAQGCQSVTVCGLAFDYCVEATAIDLDGAGFAVTVPLAATAAVDPEDAETAYMAMQAAGITLDNDRPGL